MRACVLDFLRERERAARRKEITDEFDSSIRRSCFSKFVLFVVIFFGLCVVVPFFSSTFRRMFVVPLLGRRCSHNDTINVRGQASRRDENDYCNVLGFVRTFYPAFGASAGCMIHEARAPRFCLFLGQNGVGVVLEIVANKV